jgi:cytochrome c553
MIGPWVSFSERDRLMRSWMLFVTALPLVWPTAAQAGPPDFSRDVRPILAGRCFKCHGPDAAAREAGLRLDQHDAAIAALESGERAIVPGDVEHGTLLTRVTTEDADQRMPPPSEGPALSPKEVDILRRWIAAGAKYSQHWSYVTPEKSQLPELHVDAAWCRNAIDRWILSRLQTEGLSPQPEADRATLLRRVTLDLTGLPPTLEERDAFLNDHSPEAYERVVDRLLSSPAFGERWGRAWLDLARYADSAGYADDPPRVIWKYRDWVIDALNSGMTFDEFTIEQLAGDLLPNPTNAQLTATGFHRNTMTNSEGGTDDEEFRNVAIVDRVNTTMQVWMASTTMCAQCHDHKYDPVSQKEYYQLFAILNQTADADQRDESPLLSQYSPDQLQQRGRLEQHIAEAEAEFKELASKTSGATIVEGPIAARFIRIELPGKEKILSLAEVQAFRGETNVAAGKTATQSSVAFEGPPNLAVDGNTNGHFTDAKSTTHTKSEESPWWEVDLAESGLIDRVVVWNRTDGGIGGRLNGFRIVLLDESRQARWVTTVAEAAAMDGSYPVPVSTEKLDEAARSQLADYLAANSPETAAARSKVKSLQDQLAAIQPMTTPVMRALAADKQRVTKIQIRGNFLDLGEQVSAGTPAVFPPAESSAPDRLALARWLIDRRNPLTARVLVNRMWEHLFGIGIVETSEEFGLQGELPSHPELLDWLAVEFMDRGWDMKQMIRPIVTSATYRQSSNGTEELVERDPNNRLLARGPRFRLEAELVRDQALAIAALLSDKMHGPSVKPPRPKMGLTAAFGASTDWDASLGEDRYRRGVYTFWQRSIPYPSMDTFDAPNREVCTVRRTRTNTPLQALVTLNDPVYVEAAQGLARRIVREASGLTADAEALTSARIGYAFQLCLMREPSELERKVIGETHAKALAAFRDRPEDAVKMATDPIGPVPDGVDANDLAAWTVVANVLLNLDETLTRR